MIKTLCYEITVNKKTVAVVSTCKLMPVAAAAHGRSSTRH